MAEYLLKAALQKKGMGNAFSVCSAGTMASEKVPANPFAIGVMRNFNPDIGKHLSQKITESLLRSASAIFCLAEDHRNFLISNYKKIEGKCFLVKEFVGDMNKDIADPFGGSFGDYEQIRDEINAAMDSILKFLVDGDEN
jgi:protein-tyrosine phosphatase